MLKGIVSGIVTLCIISTSALANVNISSSEFETEHHTIEFENKPFVYQNEVYIPSDEVLKALNYSVGWSDELKAIKLYDNQVESAIFMNSHTHFVGYGMYRYQNPVLISNGCAYIPISLFEDITGEEAIICDEIPPRGYISDAYRLTEQEFQDCGNCYVVNREYMFAPVSIDDESARNYAAIVNMIADKLPEVHVYNMLVPDSCEIYAPKRFFTNQNSSFHRVYDMLSNRVSPVDVTEHLFAHADEKIYFSTDHHWTQRGAYYAWEAFAALKEFSVPALNEFETNNSNRFVGSYVQRLKDFSPADVLDNGYETMERFMPFYNATATVYSDAEMTQKIGKVPLLNLSNNTYSSFLSGDHPLTVIEGGIKNGKKLAIIKDSFGNALATWAVNNYETVYVIDERGFSGGKLKIDEFYARTGFDDLIIESYPTSVQSSDLRTNLLEFAD